MRALFVVLGCLVASIASADSLRVKRLQDVWSFQTGMLIKRPEAFATSSLSYLLTRSRNPRLHAGASLGYDTYAGWQTMPLAVVVRYDSKRKNPWFLQGSAGRAWARLLPDFRAPDFREDWGGPSYYFGVGKAIRYGKIEVAWLAGYRMQRVGWREAPFVGPNATRFSDLGVSTEVDQTFRRLSLTMQVSWR